MAVCWEIFITTCAERSQSDKAIRALEELSKSLKPEDSPVFQRLVNNLLDSVATKEYVPSLSS